MPSVRPNTLLLLLALGSALLASAVARDSSLNNIQKDALKLAALHANGIASVAALPAKTSATDSIQWPSPQGPIKAKATSGPEEEHYRHASCCLQSSTFSLTESDNGPTLRQDVNDCCSVNKYGPSGPFAAKSSDAYQNEPHTSWPRPSAVAKPPSMTGTWCTWSNVDFNVTVPGVDFNTGIAPVAVVDGTCYLSPEVNQCEGIQLPFEHETGGFTPTAWTVTVRQATIYAAYAKAYVPPLYEYVSVSKGVIYVQAPVPVPAPIVAKSAYSDDPNAACGVSLAIVGQGKLFSPDGVLAGTADITSEYLWCTGPYSHIHSNGYTGPFGFDGFDSSTVCLPQISGGAPAPAPAPAPEPAPASAAGMVKASLTATGAYVMANAMHKLRQQVPLQKSVGLYMGDVCATSNVAFANPGAIKIHVDLTSPKKQYYSGRQD